MSDNLLGINVFIDSARHLCAWLEGPPMDPKHGINTAIKLLSSVYSEAMRLPKSDQPDPNIELPTVCEDHIQSMQGRFDQFPLKRFELNIPHDSSHELRSKNIFNSFSLIHQYIKNGLNYYDNGEKERAINYWRQGFKHHWGTLVAGFIYALHSYADENELI